MKRFTEILRKIFFLPPAPTVFIAAVGYALVLAVFAFGIDAPPLRYLSYAASAYALVITVTSVPRISRAAKRRVKDNALVRKVRDTALGGRLFTDVRFRTELSLYGGLFVNLFYIAVKLFTGIISRSVWFISIAVYYSLLAAMRFILLHKNKELTMETELRRYRICGVLLLVMTEALTGIVAFMTFRDKGFQYPGMLIYVMAAYSFYSIIIAIVNLAKFRKHGSPMLSAAKVIKLVAAMVSILSLETAMITQFGNDDQIFRHIMIGTTGGAVCIVVICTAIYMIRFSTKQLRALKSAKGNEESERQGNF